MENKLYDELFGAGEYFAAGFFKSPDRSRFYRFSQAYRCLFENMKLPQYDGGPLYPCGYRYPETLAVMPDYSYTFGVNFAMLRKKGLSENVVNAIGEECVLLSAPGGIHTVAGAGYTHSIPYYERVLAEGFEGYKKRIEVGCHGDFADGLLELVSGIETLVSRAVAMLERENADPRLVNALKKVPMNRAESFYEALLCWNFVFYIDGCDNPGRLDSGLFPYYEADTSVGAEDAEALLRAFFVNVDVNNGWSSALGPDYNELTVCALRAVKGIRRPSMELRVCGRLPEELADAVIDGIRSGSGNPTFFNEELYMKALADRFPEIPQSDLLRLNGGGCTETMLAGISNVGSLDAGINLLYILYDFMREKLRDCRTFEEFYGLFVERARKETLAVLDDVSRWRAMRAIYRPQPIRTLLTDDCIERGLDFNNGGARHSWSIINIAGVVNCIESLIAIRKIIYEDKSCRSDEFVRRLEDGDAVLSGLIKKCPHYGVDDKTIDNFAAGFVGKIWSFADLRRTDSGEKFVFSSIQFDSFVRAGKCVGATPDGRRACEPLADSLSPIFGRDSKGATAMLSSVAGLPLAMALGTPVVNMRLAKNAVSESLLPLVYGFFKKGGMQLQVNVISKDDMLDALVHPENHENLIVRVAGYSEYFNRLSPEHKMQIIARTEFDIM